MSNPYKSLKDYQFWRRSVASSETHLFDPVANVRFRIAPTAKVATAGSCFAQHISKRLQAIGFNFFVPEAGEHLAQDERERRNYGVFSARFGNLYTTAQLGQLFDEAFGAREPQERWLARPDGRYVDAYRQQVEPAGYATIEALLEDREAHLEAVRRMFLEADVFIFTLGLTEAWRSKHDGSVYPVAPGVVGGNFDAERYEFVNFDVSEVYAELEEFLEKLKAVNPAVNVLLTVSPVPLIATYEDRNVLVSTTYSKSVLRVVAEMALKAYDWVDYFPSYEIITGSYAGGLYYEDDYREVNARGVAHAMRCFLNHYVEGREAAASAPLEVARTSGDSEHSVICDETVLDAVR